MAEGQPPWEYSEAAANLGISVQAARQSRGSLTAPDDTTMPDRPRWKPAAFLGWKPVGRRFRTDLQREPTLPLGSEAF